MCRHYTPWDVSRTAVETDEDVAEEPEEAELERSPVADD